MLERLVDYRYKALKELDIKVAQERAKRKKDLHEQRNRQRHMVAMKYRATA